MDGGPPGIYVLIKSQLVMMDGGEVASGIALLTALLLSYSFVIIIHHELVLNINHFIIQSGLLVSLTLYSNPLLLAFDPISSSHNDIPFCRHPNLIQSSSSST